MSSPTLFSPITIGDYTLDHRIVLAPLTRLRNTDQGVPQAHCVEYYQQRTTKNGLLIAEGTKISPVGGAGYTNAPGIYTDKQVKGWKKVVDAVHAKVLIKRCIFDACRGTVFCFKKQSIFS